MDLKCSLETKTSKSGNEYKCLVINLTNDYQKIVFLDKAELALISQNESEVSKGYDPFNN